MVLFVLSDFSGPVRKQLRRRGDGGTPSRLVALELLRSLRGEAGYPRRTRFLELDGIVESVVVLTNVESVVERLEIYIRIVSLCYTLYVS